MGWVGDVEHCWAFSYIRFTVPQTIHKTHYYSIYIWLICGAVVNTLNSDEISVNPNVELCSMYQRHNIILFGNHSWWDFDQPFGLNKIRESFIIWLFKNSLTWRSLVVAVIHSDTKKLQKRADCKLREWKRLVVSFDARQQSGARCWELPVSRVPGGGTALLWLEKLCHDFWRRIHWASVDYSDFVSLQVIQLVVWL